MLPQFLKNRNRRTHGSSEVATTGKLAAVRSTFIIGCCVALFITAAAKLGSLLFGPLILAAPDPVFPFLKTSYVLLLAALLEITVAILVLSFRANGPRLATLTWISTIFLTYRMGLLFTRGSNHQCPCLGSIGQVFHVSDKTLSWTALAIVLTILGGSLFLQYLEFRVRYRRTGAERGPRRPFCRQGRPMLVFCVVICFSISSYCRGIEISGRLEAAMYALGKHPFRTTNSFSVYLDGQRARIVLREETLIHGLGHEYVDHWEYGTLSSGDSYLLTMLKSNILLSSRYLRIGGKLVITNYERPISVKLHTAAALTINSGLVPDYSVGAITPVWLAYASSNYIELTASAGGGCPIFSMGSGFRESGGRVKVIAKISDRSPHLLEVFTDYSDGNSYAEVGGRLVSRPLSKPLNSGFLDAVYRTMSWTNVGPYIIPSSFLLTRYAPADGTTLTVEAEYKGYLSDCSLDVDGQIPSTPKIPPSTRVTDNRLDRHRFRVGSYSYTTVGGRLLSVEEIPERDDFRRLRPKSTAPKPVVRLVYPLMAVVLLTPLACLFLGRYRRSKPVENQQ